MNAQERLFEEDLAVFYSYRGARQEWDRRIDSQYVATRLLLLDQRGNFPLVRYRSTEWHGLPGGKVQHGEVPEDNNLLSEVALNTLQREFQEELGLSIADLIRPQRFACLGVTETVDVRLRYTRMNFTPIFLGLVKELPPLDERALIVNIRDHIPGPLFPDARAAIELLRDRLQKKTQGSVSPSWLVSSGRLLYVRFDGDDIKVLF